jgi:spermidine/putrescine transport system substrate-binding protein
MSPLPLKHAAAGAEDQATYYTYDSWGVRGFFQTYKDKHGYWPKFATYESAHEAFTRMKAGFVVDVAHCCNTDIPRWVASGLFRTLDTDKLSNWPDLLPELWKLEGNLSGGKPYFAPFDWGLTSITYRTDLFDLQGGAETWGMLWDERYKGRLATMATAGDAWWCAAIYAGIDFRDIGTDQSLQKVADLMRRQHALIKAYSDDEGFVREGLATGAIVAAMTWNSAPAALKAEGVPVAFARPKEGALTWVCGMMLRKDAPHPDKAHDLINALLSVERGMYLIGEEGYGHSNAKAIAAFSEAQLGELGLSRNVGSILASGKFMVPQHETFETKANELYEQIKAGK